MQLQKSQMSYWLIRMLNYITSLAQGFVSSLYTALQVVQIWHTLFYKYITYGGTIKIFNYGNCKRDFTYIDDIVEGVSKVISTAPERRNGTDGLPVPPYAIYNIGNSNPENLLDFVRILSEELVSAGVLSEDYNFEEHKELVPMQPGDVPVTYADTSALEADFGFKPNTTLREGLKRFAIWYKDFYMMEGK